jgi:ankyrin repeat protein
MLDFSSLFKLRSSLIESINSNDTNRLHKLLTNDDQTEIDNGMASFVVNLNFLDHDGQTLMHRACRHGNLDIVKMLVKNGASQNIKNKDGWFPIHLATYFGHYDTVKFLINENNFQHQSLIAVYDDVTFSRVNLNCTQRNVKIEEETSSESDSSTDSDITDDDDDDDDEDEDDNSNDLDDLVNDLDLKYLELNDSNEKLLDELMLNGSVLDSSLSNSIQVQTKGNKFLSIF